MSQAHTDEKYNDTDVQETENNQSFTLSLSQRNQSATFVFSMCQLLHSHCLKAMFHCYLVVFAFSNIELLLIAIDPNLMTQTIVEAITKHFPTPYELNRAYSRCIRMEDAQNLVYTNVSFPEVIKDWDDDLLNIFEFMKSLSEGDEDPELKEMKQEREKVLRDVSVKVFKMFNALSQRCGDTYICVLNAE